MKYYRIIDDLEITERWWLGQVLFKGEGDFWQYVKAGEVVSPPSDLVVELKHLGKALDITMADFELLVVRKNAAEIFSNQDIQLIPVSIDNLKNTAQHYIMVTLYEEDCVDEAESFFEKFEVGNEIRPDLAGEYSGIYRLVIDSSKIYTHSIFRVRGYDVAVIVNEQVKLKFERLQLSGIKFLDINR